MKNAALFFVLSVAACSGITDADEDPSIDSELDDPNAPVYPPTDQQSPLTDDVIASLKAIFAAGHHQADVLSKIGDSITVSTSFARCLGSDAIHVDAALAARDPFADEMNLEAAREIFSETKVGGTTSFARVSLSATIGWMAVKAIQGTPNSALDRELDATDAAFAVVMYGTNDTWAGGQTQFRNNLTKIVDRMIARGVVPILSTIPPRRDPTANALVPQMNDIIRHVAEQKRVPLMDLWLRLSPLPQYGLGSDGIHPTAGGDGCDFSASGLQHGYNWRNLLLIEALDRMERYVVNAQATTTPPPSDPQVPPSDPQMPMSPPVSNAGTCYSATLKMNIPDGECVQSSSDDNWYQCVTALNGWVKIGDTSTGYEGPCTQTHSL